MKRRMGIAGLLVAAMAGAIVLTGRGGAGDPKAVRESVDKIALALQKGDKEGAKKMAETMGKKLEELVEVMDLFKPRKKDGIGFGEKPGASLPDGIEQMLLKIGRDAPSAASMKKDAAAYEMMGYRIAAIGLVTHAKTPAKDSGKKTRKDWTAWTDEMIAAGEGIAMAAKKQGANDVKAAAAKVNNACNSCHTVFR